MKNISAKVKKIKKSGLRKLFELAQKMDKPLDLSLGAPDLDIPAAIKRALIKNINQFQKAYSTNQGDAKVREKITVKLKAQNAIPARADEILITSGTTAALWISLSTLINPGDEVIIFDPYFVLYKSMIELAGGVPVVVSTYPNWELPINTLKNKINSKTKAIILNNPGNPTGKVYDRESLKQLAAIAARYKVWVIADEIYEELVYEKRHTSIGSLYKRSISIMGPAKAASLSGYRIAYLHAPKDLVSEMIKVQQLQYVCAPVPAQAALAVSLNLDYQNIRRHYHRKLKLVNKILGFSPGMDGAFYAFIPSGRKDCNSIIRKLRKKKVLVTPGNLFSQRNTHFRISYSLSSVKLIKALKIIKQNL